MIMKRPTDKQLFDAIEDRLSLKPSHEFSSFDSFALSTEALTAYAHLRALERLADNVHVLNDTLSVIRADLVKSQEIHLSKYDIDTLSKSG